MITIIVKKAVVILISLIPKQPYRKILTKYKIGLNRETVCQKGGNIETE